MLLRNGEPVREFKAQSSISPTNFLTPAEIHHTLRSPTPQVPEHSDPEEPFSREYLQHYKCKSVDDSLPELEPEEIAELMELDPEEFPVSLVKLPEIGELMKLPEPVMIAQELEQTAQAYRVIHVDRS